MPSAWHGRWRLAGSQAVAAVLPALIPSVSFRKDGPVELTEHPSGVQSTSFSGLHVVAAFLMPFASLPRFPTWPGLPQSSHDIQPVYKPSDLE